MTATPSKPSTCHAPVITIARPVMVHIIIVSIKVPVIDTSPCLTGSLVLAAAAAIGAEPSPASLEKIPLAIPFCMATIMLPTIPPVTACGLKAPLTMVTNAAGICFTLHTRSKTLKTTYITAIKGTTTCDTFAILLIPPIKTSATHTLSTREAITTVHEYVPIPGIVTA